MDAALVGHGGKMQGAVGGPSGGGHDHGGVLERLQGADLPGPDVLLDQAHHRLARGDGILIAALIGGGKRAGERQGEADGFGDAGHGVGGELPAAGAVAGAGDPLQGGEILQRHDPRRVIADAFEDIDHGDVAALPAARHDRPAIQKHRRHIEAQHGHHHARQALVAAGDPHQGVIAMAAHGELHRIGDDLPADERRAHALMAHGDPVGDGDGAELPGRGAGGLDAFSDRVRLTHQSGVAGRRLVPAGGHADEGLGDFPRAQAHGVIVGAVRGAGGAFRNVPAGEPGLIPASITVSGHARLMDFGAASLNEGAGDRKAQAFEGLSGRAASIGRRIVSLRRGPGYSPGSIPAARPATRRRRFRLPPARTGRRRNVALGVEKDAPVHDIAVWRRGQSVLGPLAPVRPETEISTDRRHRILQRTL